MPAPLQLTNDPSGLQMALNCGSNARTEKRLLGCACRACLYCSLPISHKTQVKPSSAILKGPGTWKHNVAERRMC
eukprot:1208624-Amphidinium_carterae.1